MQLTDLKLNLANFLKGDLSAETETMLSTLGYVRKSEVKQTVAEKPKYKLSDAELEPFKKIVDSYKKPSSLVEDARQRAIALADQKKADK